MMQIQQAAPNPVRPMFVSVARRVIERVRAAQDPALGASVSPFAQRRPEGTLKATIPWAPGSKKLGVKSPVDDGAMFFYRNLVRMPTATGKTIHRKTAMYLYGGVAMTLAWPKTPQDDTPSKSARKGYRKLWATLSSDWTEDQISSLVSVKKEDDGFTVVIPVFYASEHMMDILKGYYYTKPGAEGNDGDDDESDSTSMGINQDSADASPASAPDLPQEDFQLQERFYPAHELDKRGVFARYMERLKATPKAGFWARRHKNNWLFSLQVKFTQEQATVLCQTPWLELRPIDFYALMRTWSDTRAGQMRADPPLYSLPLGRIARELPAGAPTRLSKDLNIMVDQRAEYWWLQDANQINKFDANFQQHLQRADGSLCSVSTDPNDPVFPAPKSGPVFVDWVNLKLSFVNAEGRMEVIGLDRCVAANATHYYKLLNTSLVSFLGLNTISTAVKCGIETGFPVHRLQGKANPNDPSSFEKEKYPDIITKWLLKNAPEYENGEEKDIPLYAIYTYRQLNPVCAAYCDLIDHVLHYADTSIENLYARYSYRTVSHLIAALKILATHAPNVATVRAQDMERRKAALEQDNLVADYTLEDIPYVRQQDSDDPRSGRGLMPHQFRTARRLARSPNFAILAVDAGGGKTTSYIIDMLKEMGKGNVRRCLIMCPAHLVAQYVKEFLYFTDSRVNVIAVNSYTLETHGLEGLAEMLSKAPPNSIVVTDYNLAQGKTKSPSMGYGAAATRYYPIVEMLRSFSFDYVGCDESHFLKGTTGRQAAVARLISDIPYKRLASGTITPNAITDLVQQISLLDPTILPREELLAKYALKTSNGKVTSWKPGYEADLLKDIKGHVVWCKTKRKEWAALLPTLKENVHYVDMTPEQRRVYRLILDDIVAQIKAAALKNKNLRKALGLDKGASAEDTGFSVSDAPEGDDGEGDEDEGGGSDEADDPVDLDALLKPYLSRLERFAVAPAADPLGAKELAGDDLISPKVHEVIRIFREHLASGVKGKILIFCNYIESGIAIYEGMPPDLKAMSIHYMAGEKERCGAEFENNDKKMMMVGVETSMNTGLNLQFCSRLIRVDTVWTPGSLEQGNSRIQRPNLKVAETRPHVYLDWILAQHSIDITKLCFLFQKQVTIGKFEEAGNPRFDNIEVPDAFKMTLDVIRHSDSKDSDDLYPYFSSYKRFKEAEFAEFRDYRLRNQQDLDPATGGMKMTVIKRAPNQTGAQLMYRLPYVVGTELYKAADLGLVRYDAYLRLEESELEDTEDESDTESADGKLTQRELNMQELQRVQGLGAHTEYGDGLIVGVGRTAVAVELASGGRVTVPKLSTFIVTRAQTNGHDLRELLLRQIGDVPFDKPIEIQVKDPKSVKIPKEAPKAKEATPQVDVSLNLVIMNDVPGLMLTNATRNPSGALAMEAFGFTRPNPYYYAEFRDAQHLYAQMKKWSAEGFTFHPDFNPAVRDLYMNLSKMRANAATLIGLSTAASLRNFFRMLIKPVPDRTLLCPYPLVIDDEAGKNSRIFLALPKEGHPASALAIRHRPSGVTWREAEVDDQRANYYPTLSALVTALKEMSNQGIVLSNLPTIKSHFLRLRRKYYPVIDPAYVPPNQDDE